MTTITITIPIEEAASILRTHAELAAKYSAILDHVTRRTYSAPQQTGETFDAARERWQQRFLKSKRIVDGFGVDFSPTSFDETITISYPYTKGGKSKIVDIAGFKFNRVTGSKTDYSRPTPTYRMGVHSDACAAAAERTVRAWRAKVSGEAVS